MFGVDSGFSPPVLTSLYEILNSYRHHHLLTTYYLLFIWFDNRKHVRFYVSHPEMDKATGSLDTESVCAREVEGIEGPDCYDGRTLPVAAGCPTRPPWTIGLLSHPPGAGEGVMIRRIRAP